MVRKKIKEAHRLLWWSMQSQKEVIFIQKQPSCERIVTIFAFELLSQPFLGYHV